MVGDADELDDGRGGVSAAAKVDTGADQAHMLGVEADHARPAEIAGCHEQQRAVAQPGQVARASGGHSRQLSRS